MAHRIIAQVVLTGARVLGRSFAAAYRQAQASSKYQAALAKNPGMSAGSGLASGAGAGSMPLDEAVKILNVSPPSGAATNMQEVTDRFKRLFDANDPTKGGSFYLQSKILRARERIEAEVLPKIRQQEMEAELSGRPQIYRSKDHDKLAK